MSEIDIKEWLILSSHDAETAGLLIKEKGHADIIIYHVHQAVEKLLKALAVFNKFNRVSAVINKLIKQT